MKKPIPKMQNPEGANFGASEKMLTRQLNREVVR